MQIFKHFRSGLKILFSRFSDDRIPLKVNYLCTFKCTNKCSYCNIHRIKKHNELTTVEAKRMIFDLRKSGAQLINFIGGEPLVRDDIVNLMKYSKKIGLMVSVSTNSELTIVKKDILNYLDYYITTLNGPEMVHDKIRGKGNFQKVLSVLDIIPKRIPKIVTFIITRQNMNSIGWILELAKTKNFNVNFQPVFSNELARIDDGEIGNQALSDSKVKRIFKKLLRLKHKGAPISNSYYSLKHFAGSRKFDRCFIGKYNITIDPAGNLHRCYKTTDKMGSNSVIKFGLRRALEKMKIDNCTKCDYGCHVEENGLFSFSPSSIYELILKK